MASAPDTVDAPVIDILTLTADIVSAHVSNNRLGTADLPALITSVHGALSGLSKGSSAPSAGAATETRTGAVSVRKSLADPHHIISMIDGKPYALLKRHLNTHSLTPAQYREKFGLKPDYPMVAPAYAEKRRALAIQIGLGRKAKATPPSKAPAARRKLKIAAAG